MLQYLVQHLRLLCGGVPAVVEDEDVGFGETLTHTIEEVLLLSRRWREWGQCSGQEEVGGEEVEEACTYSSH